MGLAGPGHSARGGWLIFECLCQDHMTAQTRACKVNISWGTKIESCRQYAATRLAAL